MKSSVLKPPERQAATSGDTAVEVLRQFRLIIGSVRHHFREVEEHCGLSGSQMWLLTEAGRTPGIGIGELAGRLAIHQSTCSQLVEKLVARELLVKQRSREDQRRVGLYLTEAGHASLTRLPGPPEGILPEALKTLPEAQLQSLKAGLAEVIRKLRTCEERYAATPLADIVAGKAQPASSREDEACNGR